MKTLEGVRTWRPNAAVLKALLVTGGVLALTASVGRADTGTIGFEAPTYTIGSINGQGGWGGQTPPGIAVNPSIDQGVTSAAARTGLQSYRESSAYTTGSFGDQVFSPSLVDRAGEGSSAADGLAGGSLQARFTTTLWFKSVFNTPQDSHVVISPDRGDGARMSWVQVSDNVTNPGDGRQGLSVSFYDYQVPVPDDFVFHVVAANLVRTDWHRIDFEMNFYEGPGNDVVKVSVDGGPQTVGASWEDYFRNVEGNPTRPVDSLLFRVAGPVEGAVGSGFYFDDVSYSSGPCLSATRYVTTTGSDTYNDCSAPGAPCATVQHAVDVACTGDVVSVGAGTFTEQVTVAKSVVIDGAGKASTTILAPATLPCSGSIVTIQGTGNTVQVKELTVSGPGPNTCGCAGIRAGVEVKAAATAILNDNAVTLIRNADQAGLGGCQNGVGIIVGGSGGAASATVQSNDITSYQKNGLVVSGGGSTATITGNTVDGGGSTVQIARNGIQVSGGATAAVTGNTVSNHQCDHPVCGPDPVSDTQSTGILLFDVATSTTVTGNTVSANDNGIYTFASAPGAVQITNNTIGASRYEGVFLDQGTANLTGNAVTGGNYGVIAVAYTGATGNSVGTLSCNRIGSTGIGIGLIDDNPGGDAFIPSITAHNNLIAGNTTGASNATTTTMNAENNFWGSGSGPNPPGSGDPIVGPVDAIPFLAGLPACIACTTNADCQNGLACDGAEACVANTCQPGTPITCGVPTFCQTSVACQEPTGSCVPTPKPDGILCTDGRSCTIGDTCQAGVCQPGPGDDADGDGDCDSQEVACGCNPNDGSEVCVLPNRLVGRPGSAAGEVLLNWYSPTVQKVTIASDPSCRTSGIGLCSGGRCQAGKVPDLCTTDADCYEALDTCRVVVNYADVPANRLLYAKFGKDPVPGFVAGTPTPQAPIAVAAGCSKKVDVLIPQRRSNKLKVKAKGTVGTFPRSDLDSLRYGR